MAQAQMTSIGLDALPPQLELRGSLEAARDRQERDAARRALAELVPPDLSGH